MNDLKREAIAVLTEIWELSPTVRLGQLMAHLDFLSQAHAGKSIGYIEDDELLSVMSHHRAELTARFNKPRCHHYTLAHHALRSIALDDPSAYVTALSSPNASEFLSDLLRQVSEHCREKEPQANFGIKELGIHKVRVGRNPAMVIEMPMPRATGEAYFTATVVVGGSQEGSPKAGPSGARNFTLEKGFTFGGPSRTVLCEWTSDGTHSNFGDGPAPRLEHFIRAIEDLLSGNP